MLIKAEESLLLLIDLQERLAPAIDDVAAVLRHNIWLVEVAQRLAVPVGATVQYPAGLGPMVGELTPASRPSEWSRKSISRQSPTAAWRGCPTSGGARSC